MQACQAAGLKTLLISGGFTFFSERIRQHLKLDFARANTLGVFNGRLTGTLFDRPWGDIVDGAEKKRVLLEVCELMGISTEQAIAVGDGANDLPMMMAAGLSIAYHPKPAVREKALISIMSGGMDRALGDPALTVMPLQRGLAGRRFGLPGPSAAGGARRQVGVQVQHMRRAPRRRRPRPASAAGRATGARASSPVRAAPRARPRVRPARHRASARCGSW